jgi:hypothetical protein
MDINNGVKNAQNALSEENIKNFWVKHFPNVKFQFRYLKDIVDDPDNIPFICIVHTGLEKNSVNNGYNDHWLLIIYDKLFDSYSYQHHYNLGKLKDIVTPVKLHPNRLQEFGAVVCGEYCLNFLDFYYKHKDSGDIGLDYCKLNGYTTNQKENDIKVLKWYETNKQ